MKKTVIIITMLAASLVMAITALALVLWKTQQPAMAPVPASYPAGPSQGIRYEWRCQIVQPGRPQVTIRDLGSQPLPVYEIAVAIFGPEGSQIASTNIFASSINTYIAPGSSLTFTGYDYSPAWDAGICKVENIS